MKNRLEIFECDFFSRRANLGAPGYFWAIFLYKMVL